METIKAEKPTCPRCEQHADNPVLIDGDNREYVCVRCGQKYTVDTFVVVACYCTSIGD